MCSASPDTIAAHVQAPLCVCVCLRLRVCCLQLWSMSTGQIVATVCGHSDAVFTAEVSPNGRWLLSAGSDYGVHVWDLAALLEAASVTKSAAKAVGGAHSFDTSYKHPRLLVDGSDSSSEEDFLDSDSDDDRNDGGSKAIASPSRGNVAKARKKHTAEAQPPPPLQRRRVAWRGCMRPLLLDVWHSHVDTVYQLALSADSGLLVTASHDLSASLWQIRALRTYLIAIVSLYAATTTIVNCFNCCHHLCVSVGQPQIHRVLQRETLPPSASRVTPSWSLLACPPSPTPRA